MLIYPDVREAVDWLCRVFGFSERLQIGDSHRSQLQIGNAGAVIVGDVRGNHKPPQDEIISHQIIVRIESLKDHYAQAYSLGARILSEPTDFPYGERKYEAEDLAGHYWIFTETIKDVDPQEWGGLLKIS